LHERLSQLFVFFGALLIFNYYCQAPLLEVTAACHALKLNQATSAPGLRALKLKVATHIRTRCLNCCAMHDGPG
jgi:hypothetical protein